MYVRTRHHACFAVDIICKTAELDASESDGKDDCECTETVQKCLTLSKKGDLGIKDQECKTSDP